MIDKILDFIKSLFSIYWKTRPFRAFITLDTLVLVGFSALKITYNVTSGKHSWGIEVTQGEYNWIIVIILAIINIPFAIWLINDLLKAKLELLQKVQYKVEVGYFFEGNVEMLSPTFEEKRISYKLKEQPKSLANNPLLGMSPFQIAIADFQNINRNVVQATSVQIVRGEINKSFYPIQFYLENIGIPSLKCFEITFYFGNDVTEIRSNNKKMNSVFGVEIPHPSSTYIDEEEKNVLLKGRDLLVGSNNIATKPIFVKPVYPTEKITVHWKLLADEFNQTGSFDVPVSYDIREKHENRFVDTPDELQNDIETICDYIESIT